MPIHSHFCKYLGTMTIDVSQSNDATNDGYQADQPLLDGTTSDNFGNCNNIFLFKTLVKKYFEFSPHSS